jgi:bifunctional non-homologous end joining protein LigD
MPSRDPLSAYRQKRDFKRTSEPAGERVRPGGSRFVIHKHHATADHYDLRLEHDGLLKSWAVPKGPSLNPADKRYAVETEDHPLEYIDFEAVIPEGEYGGGPMIVWDTGEWAPMGDMDAGLKKGDFKFRLYGQKVTGGFVLVRMKPKPGDKKTNWLLIKETDDSVDRDIDIVAARPESVKSGLTIEELLQQSKRPAAPAPRAKARKAAKLAPSKLSGAVPAVMPQKFKPMLATQGSAPPAGATGWIHEIKYDGYRTLAFVTGGKVRLLTRTGIDWTDRYGVLADAFSGLSCKEAIIDGEIVVVDETGVTHFSDLQQALSDKASERLTFFAFDLVHLDGYDITKAPLIARKELLRALVAPVAGPQSAIHFSDHVGGEGRVLYEQAVELGLEGILSKKENSPYIQERSKTWMKTKSVLAGDFPIVGYTESAANGGLGALALGRWVAGELEYSGNVGTGFDAATMAMLLKRLKPLAAGGHRLDRMLKDIIPVRPVLTAHIHYANLTADGSVRHGVFKSLREPEFSQSEAPVERVRLITDADLASISITNAGRTLFGKTGPTKLDLALYYAQVGDFMLPHIFGRPVSLVRSPSGKIDDLFFQRHPFFGMPKSIATFETLSSEDGEKRKYLSVVDTKGYLGLAQFGVIEFHAWNCHFETLEQPDQVIFDLDPGEGIRWKQIVEAAFLVRDQLTRIGLTPFVKTSGGKGLHVVVPLKRKLDWKQTHAGTGEIATAIARAAPETFVVNMAKDKRAKRIFIDFHRNGRLATAVAPYSLRARPNLPASTPVNWSDLRSIDAPEDLNYSSLPGFLETSGDPWAAMDEAAGDLAAALRQLK